MNADLERQFAVWRETELPKIRERAIASGFVSRVLILDCIVSAAELQADPFEVWQYEWLTDGWHRVEIDG
jgi:hypothetical protein